MKHVCFYMKIQLLIGILSLSRNVHYSCHLYGPGYSAGEVKL